MNDPENDPHSGYRPDLDRYTTPDPQPRLRSGWWIFPLIIASFILWTITILVVFLR